MDAFGNIHAKPLDKSTALSPKYQSAKEFTLYHEGLDQEIGRVEVAPYDGILNEEFIDLDLSDDILDKQDSEIYLAMEHAEEAINEFYAENFPSMESSQPSNLGLVEKAEQVLEENQQKRNPGIYQY